MDLTGVWRVAPVDEDLRRHHHDPDLDDASWPTLAVPGHWADVNGLGDATSVAHRVRFDGPADTDGTAGTDDGDPADGGRRRWWLRLDGIATQGDVWLDGAYLGDTDGYFVPHVFEVTDLLAARRDHLLAVEVSCPEPGDAAPRSVLTGALQDPSLLGHRPRGVGGIWSGVRLVDTGPVAMRHVRVVCLEADENRARLALRVVLDAPEATELVLRTRIGGHEHERAQPAARGETRVEWMVDVPRPDLWWPHNLGEPTLVDLEIAALVDGKVSDRRRRRTGLRSIRRRRGTLLVNGERLFVRGVGWVPTEVR
ncbi:MAG: hypothetical protein D6683_12695, partial [Actinomyces sp.]